LSSKRKNSVDASWHEAVDAACDFEDFAFPSETKTVVVSLQHNGLGNQIFQYAAARLFAFASGSRFRARSIRPEEGALDSKMPPHSEESWKAFRDIFDDNEFPEEEESALGCASLSTLKKEYDLNGTIILGQRPADGKRVPLTTLLTRSLSAKCVKTLGYFQDFGLFRGAGKLLRQFLTLKTRPLTEEPLETEIVAHVRLCNGPMHYYRYYDLDNYFKPILDQYPNRTLKVITGCDAKKRGIVNDLVTIYGAKVAQPRFREENTTVVRSIAADFLYLARAKTLIVTESTYGFWAAFLSQASTVHAPADGSVPVPYLENNYVFHDIKKAKYWGHYDPTSKSILYAEKETLQNSSSFFLGSLFGRPPLAASELPQHHRHHKRHFSEQAPIAQRHVPLPKRRRRRR